MIYNSETKASHALFHSVPCFQARKLDTYRQTAKTQEKVISKLEKILENSLQEASPIDTIGLDSCELLCQVQKAQKVQAP